MPESSDARLRFDFRSSPKPHTMEEITRPDGSTCQVPIYSGRDLASPVFRYFGLEFGDPAIKTAIVNLIHQVLHDVDVNTMAELIGWLETLQIAYFNYTPHEMVLAGYEAWAKAKCDLLLQVARQTRTADGILQHVVNYQDFHIEVLPYNFGPPFIAALYDLRGLDFFLWHYMGGETDAHSDAALFEHANCVPTSLMRLERQEEAKRVQQELEQRRHRFTAISQQYRPPAESISESLTQDLRLVGERFWIDYLEHDVWRSLTGESRTELLDAYVIEYFLKEEILTSWSTVTLNLCKVVEREMVESLVSPWRSILASATFTSPNTVTNALEKRVASRRMTFELLKNAALGIAAPPTLGQLIFVAQYWQDELMDSCTDVLSAIRATVAARCSTHSKSVRSLAQLLRKPVSHQVPPAPSVLDLRNASAHPRPESGDWRHFSEWLKHCLARPPKQILRLLCVDLRPRMPE